MWIPVCLSGCTGTPPLVPPPVIVAPPPAPQPSSPPPQPQPPPPAPETELRLELSDEQKAALSAQATKDLEETERLIGGLDRQRLTAEQQEKLQTVESLVSAAKTAEEKGDVPGRANLARKARLLAEELVPG